MSIAPPGFGSDENDPGHGGRHAGDGVEYEFKSVQALRGREGSAKATWQNRGWELVSESRGTLRTELRFRREKPKTFGAHVAEAVAAIRRLQPRTRSVALAASALTLTAVAVAVGVGAQSGDDTSVAVEDRSLASSAAPTAPSAPPAASGVTDGAAAATAPDATRPEAAADQVPADEPSAAGAALNRKDNAELSALLKVSEPCGEDVAAFATKYDGRRIEFNGSIKHTMLHGDRKTRYDFLITAGNEGPQSTTGPDFKFKDVNVFDLNFPEAQHTSFVDAGDRFLFVADITEFNPDQCLFYLNPVSTTPR